MNELIPYFVYFILISQREHGFQAAINAATSCGLIVF